MKLASSFPPYGIAPRGLRPLPRLHSREEGCQFAMTIGCPIAHTLRRLEPLRRRSPARPSDEESRAEPYFSTDSDQSHPMGSRPFKGTLGICEVAFLQPIRTRLVNLATTVLQLRDELLPSFC